MDQVEGGVGPGHGPLAFEQGKKVAMAPFDAGGGSGRLSARQADDPVVPGQFLGQ